MRVMHKRVHRMTAADASGSAIVDSKLTITNHVTNAVVWTGSGNDKGTRKWRSHHEAQQYC